jgi:ribonuclease VapC
MIAVDTSALMAILLDEPEADACIAALEAADEILISATTAAEALIVAARRNVADEMDGILGKLGFEVIGVTFETARRVAQAYAKWGKGLARRGALNFGDCFAYDVARQHACPLLYVGSDFAKTDVQSVL